MLIILCSSNEEAESHLHRGDELLWIPPDDRFATITSLFGRLLDSVRIVGDFDEWERDYIMSKVKG